MQVTLRKAIRPACGLALPLVWFEIVRAIAGDRFSLDGFLIRLGFTLAVILPWRLKFILPLAALASGIYLAWGLPGSSWAALAAFYAALIAVDQACAPQATRWKRWLLTPLRQGTLAGIAGVGIVLLDQAQIHFAEEEFFIALQALALAVGWLTLRQARTWVTAPKTHSDEKLARWVLVGLLIAIPFVGWGGLRAYQASFYPQQAPAYPGISAEQPFLCGQAPADTQTYSGEDVFQQYLKLVQDNPRKAAPEYGMLALATRQDAWAQKFHDELLGEAAQGQYTQAANSVKSVQHLAALRVYYYANVRQAFPQLFSADEQARVAAWFAAINRRALTVEWVDWLYAVALGKLPEGPYENQESGAGLLAVLEVYGLGDPQLSAKNRDYLERNRRGWAERFRVTDDAAIYQPEWMVNAYFQSLYTGENDAQTARRSVDWLALQALPDGTRLKYNHIGAAEITGLMYLAAGQYQDPAYLWLAGRALEASQTRGVFATAQPGLEEASPLVGQSPTWGSCLIYGDSGMPNQVGPLAPDKIVMRDGWGPDAIYLLLDLRFSGWHRYKATNTLSLIYQGDRLTSENLSGETFSWLPKGRSLFRDKRVPRENLNGLVVERSGLNAAIYTLTGIGGPWAQNPPYDARVESFTTNPEVDQSTTVIEGWNGWTQQRAISLYRGGPLVVIDQAQGPGQSAAAILWHLPAEAHGQGGRITLRGGENPAEVVLVALRSGQLTLEAETGGQRLAFQSKGQLALVTIFLSGQWVGAEIDYNLNRLSIRHGGQTIEIPVTVP